MSFDAALQLVLDLEGGYVLTDRPDDPGGRTYAGVTQHLCDEIYGQGRDVATLAESDVRHIYQVAFWEPCRCTEMPWPLSAVVFQAAVNCGQGDAITMLQCAVGTFPDGKVGPLTLGVLTDALEQSRLFLAAQRQRIRDTHRLADPNFKGLLNRTARVGQWLALHS